MWFAEAVILWYMHIHAHHTWKMTTCISLRWFMVQIDRAVKVTWAPFQRENRKHVNCRKLSEPSRCVVASLPRCVVAQPPQDIICYDDLVQGILGKAAEVRSMETRRCRYNKDANSNILNVSYKHPHSSRIWRYTWLAIPSPSFPYSYPRCLKSNSCNTLWRSLKCVCQLVRHAVSVTCLLSEVRGYLALAASLLKARLCGYAMSPTNSEHTSQVPV